MKDLEALNEKANERNVGEVGVKESFSGKKRKLQQDSVELEKDVEVEYIRNPASAPSFASSSLSLSSYSTPSSSVDPAVMRQKAFETIQRVTPMIEKMIEKQGSSDNDNSNIYMILANTNNAS